MGLSLRQWELRRGAIGAVALDSVQDRDFILLHTCDVQSKLGSLHPLCYIASRTI